MLEADDPREAAVSIFAKLAAAEAKAPEGLPPVLSAAAGGGGSDSDECL